MSVTGTPSSLGSGKDKDPLLKDFDEKKQSFRRNVVSLAAELREARSRFASREESFARETLRRKEAESKAEFLEKEVCILQKRLEEKEQQLQDSSSTNEKYMKELDVLRSQLAYTQATAESVDSAQRKCLALLEEFDENNRSLKDGEGRVDRLAEQLNSIRKDLQQRETSQKELKEEILKVEQCILQLFAMTRVSNNREMRKMMNEVLVIKDEEITKMKHETKIMCSHWKMKTEEFESQLEKHRMDNEELRNRVLILELYHQEASKYFIPKLYYHLFELQKSLINIAIHLLQDCKFAGHAIWLKLMGLKIVSALLSSRFIECLETRLFNHFGCSLLWSWS